MKTTNPICAEELHLFFDCGGNYNFPLSKVLYLVFKLLQKYSESKGWVHLFKGFPCGSVVKNPLQCRRCWFGPWVEKIPWRRKWQPTPVFLPGKSHGQRSLAGCGPWSHKELDITEHPHRPLVSTVGFWEFGGTLQLFGASCSLFLTIRVNAELCLLWFTGTFKELRKHLPDYIFWSGIKDILPNVTSLVALFLYFV